jgi:hypothetical protein
MSSQNTHPSPRAPEGELRKGVSGKGERTNLAPSSPPDAENVPHKVANCIVENKFVNRQKHQPKRKFRGQWQKGVSGNPSGRPAGSRNKATLVLEALLEGEGERLARKAIAMALGGDPHALRLCVERLLPPRKERLIELPFPDAKTARDASAALACILTAVGEGQITPGEGQLVAEIVEAQKRVIEVEDHDRRIAELEKAVEKDKGGRR